MWMLRDVSAQCIRARKALATFSTFRFIISVHRAYMAQFVTVRKALIAYKILRTCSRRLSRRENIDHISYMDAADVFQRISTFRTFIRIFTTVNYADVFVQYGTLRKAFTTFRTFK
ncbi:hypothetical protein CEXT_773921 [Caerostris extrusa]|uniref:Uncharacterized protein n=1 Tax=Caerostris extrusa TaxID=172846 RepID=A0AAV4RK83_CAEEX|nr:hypothetical protein CEXT_773921 [Caerostris extrusa]